MFKFDKKKMKSALDRYMKNEFWSGNYKNAPSDTYRSYMRLMFYYSEYNEPTGKDFAEVRDKLYDKFTIDDWKYLQKLHVGTPLYAVAQKHIEEME